MNEKKLKKENLKIEREKTLTDLNGQLVKMDEQIEESRKLLKLIRCQIDNEKNLDNVQKLASVQKTTAEALACLEKNRQVTADKRAELLKEKPKDKAVITAIIGAVSSLVTAIVGVFLCAYSEDILGKLIKPGRISWFKKK